MNNFEMNVNIPFDRDEVTISFPEHPDSTVKMTKKEYVKYVKGSFWSKFAFWRKS